MDKKQQFLNNLRHPGTALVFIAIAVSFFFIVVVAMGSTLNAVFIVALAALFLLCLRLIPPHELGYFYQYSVWVIVFAFFLNSWYELLHSGLYKDWMTYNYYVIALLTFISAATDAAISWTLFIITTIVRKGRWNWGQPWSWKAILLVIGIALVGQTIGEVFALRTGRWSYGPYMPVVPVLGVGLTPLLQIPLMIPITFWLAQRATCQKNGDKEEKVRS